MYQTIQWEVREHVGILTLNRPDRLNAVDTAMRSDIADAVRKAEYDPDVWTLIVTGNGRGFCSGADLKARSEAESKVGAANANSITVQPMFDVGYYYPIAFGEISKPVIAAVNGVTRGAGNNMVFAADFRIASDKANFGCNFVERGLMAEASAYYLPRLVGMAIATEICMLGEPFDAAQALAWGLVNKVVPQAGLLDAAYGYARRIAANAPLAVQAAKELAVRSRELDRVTGLRFEAMVNRMLSMTEDAKEGPAAFAAKRKPEFKGR